MLKSLCKKSTTKIMTRHQNPLFDDKEIQENPRFLQYYTLGNTITLLF